MEENKKNTLDMASNEENEKMANPNGVEELSDDDMANVVGGASHHAPTTTQRRTSTEYESLKFKYSTPGEPKDARPEQCNDCYGSRFVWRGAVPHKNMAGKIVNYVQVFTCDDCGRSYYAVPKPGGGYYTPIYLKDKFYGTCIETDF